MRKLTKQEYINKANIIHKNRYFYDNLIYISSTKKIKIICKEHGEFEQEANSHLRGIGCPECSGNTKCNTSNFIKKSKLVHGDKYDYSKVDYINAKTSVKIICKEHGEFEQTPNNHLNNHGCNFCGCKITNSKNRKKLEKFISDAIAIHGDRYDYSKVEYINAKKMVKIICKEHGEFLQNPNNHLNSICKKCSIDENKKRLTKTKEKFISDAIAIHGDKYNYSLVEYFGCDFKIDIICKKHGIFNQKCSKHLQNQGCPTCSESKLEKEIRLFLIDNNINFIQEYGKKNHTFYLKGQLLDFYLPEYKIAIECQGQQHFSPVDFGNKGEEYTKKQFDKIVSRDINKYNMCKELNIDIIFYCKINNFKKNYIGDLFYNNSDILTKIKNKK